MRDTVIKDTKKILDARGLTEVTMTGDRSGSPMAQFPNGSFIRFIGLDKPDVGKGLRSDLTFFNEANKCDFESYREFTSRAKRIIIDYNPNEKFWAHDEVHPREDCEHIVLTYKDNEFLSEEEVAEILNYKKKGYDGDKIINEYWANKWRIYGLGQIGGVEGRIFNWKKIDYADYLKIPATEYIGVDWGTVDPFGVVAVRYSDGNLYCTELNYKSENQWRQGMNEAQLTQIGAAGGDGFVTWLFTRLNIPKSAYVICDTNRPGKVVALRKGGWEYAVTAPKKSGSILDGIDLLQNLNVFYTSESPSIEHEQYHYKWDEDRQGNRLNKPVDHDNHLIDAIRYVALWLAQEGVIRTV